MVITMLFLSARFLIKSNLIVMTGIQEVWISGGNYRNMGLYLSGTRILIKEIYFDFLSMSA